MLDGTMQNMKTNMEDYMLKKKTCWNNIECWKNIRDQHGVYYMLREHKGPTFSTLLEEHGGSIK